MYKINYKIENNDKLFENFQKIGLKNIQNYVPIYNKIFNISNMSIIDVT